jgi:hypothetical protein
MRSLRYAALAVLVLAAAGCRGDAEPAVQADTEPAAEAMPTGLHVMDVQLGNALTPEKLVTAAATEFGPMDTIYASVATEGTAVAATLAARWTYQDGQLVDETSQSIAPTGPAVTEFHIAKPDGFPAGQYKVEITLTIPGATGGAGSASSAVTTREFTVK